MPAVKGGTGSRARRGPSGNLRVFARIFVAVLLLAGALSGCSSSSQALLDTAKSLRGGGTSDDPARLDPRFRYLRISVDGRTALLVLGYVDAHPQGPIEVWYSAEREVIRLQNGRLAGASGLTTEWRRVTLDAPGWTAAVASGAPLEWTRRRDVMPGYRYGVEDRLTLSRISPPTDSRLVGLEPASLLWFEESVAQSGDTARDLPPARYALDLRAIGDPVVYGEACLASDLCFAWQRWPVAAPQGIGAR